MRWPLASCCFVLATAVLLSEASAAEAKRPNIVVILADDVGFSDLGCYGSEIETPNLDRLAAGGLRFTQFYNTGRCCPTRASLLTGLYPHQAGIGHMMNDRGVPGYRGRLNRSCVTLAEVLKTAGYHTYMAGKWHVTPFKHADSEVDKSNWPLQRGFDRFYGTIQGAGSYFDPSSLTRDNTHIVPEDPDNYYYTDALTENALTFLQEHPEDEPFFLYMAYTAAHWPLHAKPADIAKYRGRYAGGWDKLRKQRYQRMIELGLIDPQWKLSKHVRPWKDVKHKEWFERRMEVYAAMLDCMDQNIGRVLTQLEQSGELDNTLVLFMQDNGGCQEERDSHRPEKTVFNPLGEVRAMRADELQQAAVPPFTRDGRPLRTGLGVMPGPADTYLTYGIEWANASNTPFRMYKHFVHEGGISTPLIAHWPAGIPAEGELRHQPSHLIDVMATCVELSGAKYPRTFAGQEILPMEGTSLLPAFDDQPLERDALFWEHEGNRAVRVGDWKLVSRGSGSWELYDLRDDRSEVHNLAKQHPERVKQLAEMYDRWAVRAHVVPRSRRELEQAAK